MQIVQRIGIALTFVALGCGMWPAPAEAQSGPPNVPVQWHFEKDAAHPGDVVRAALEVHVPLPYHVHSNKPHEDFLIPTRLSVEPPEGFELLGVAYPKAVDSNFSFSEIPVSVFEEKFVIGVALKASDTLAPGDYTAATKLRYQACDDDVCYAPKNVREEISLAVVAPEEELESLNAALFASIDFGDLAPVEPIIEAPVVAVVAEDCDVLLALEDFDVIGTAGGILKPNEFIEFLDNAESGNVKKGPFEGKGPIAIMLLILVGGVALNLTPCVLPLIPINLAIIGAGAQSGSRARGFFLGGTYGLAMALVYGILGLIVILTAGTFGTINSTLWFNASIAVLFVVLGLAMFDVIQIDFSKFQTKMGFLQSGKKGSFALAFGMGGVAALLAGACVAPVVIQVIVYSSDLYNKGNTIALGLPFLLGLGMALPWPLAGGGMSVLPKPGAWMVRVKQAMGVFIIGFALYYGYLAYGIWDNRRGDATLITNAIEAQLEGGWTASMCSGLAEAQAEEKLVFVDMWATWCKNCLAMDKGTFKNDAVVARMEDYVKIKFQAEDPNATPAKEMLKLFDGIGLPAYAVLRPKSMAPAVEPAEAALE